jgi:hypothetical protein
MLGQAAGLMGQQYAGQAAFGNQVLNNLTQQGAYIPQNQSQWYQNQMAGANANFQAASYPQQQAQQDWLNRQNFTLSSIGATPLPSQIPGGMSFGSQSQNPSAAQNIGTGLLAASMLWP